MPNPYDYQNINYMNPQANKGALYGALIAAALSAATGRNTGDSVLKGLAGGVSGYGSGIAATQDYYSKLIEDQLKQKTYQQGQRAYEESQKRYEETTKPYMQSGMDINRASLQDRYQKMIQDQLNRPYEQRESRIKYKKLKADASKAEADAIKAQRELELPTSLGPKIGEQLTIMEEINNLEAHIQTQKSLASEGGLFRKAVEPNTELINQYETRLNYLKSLMPDTYGGGIKKGISTPQPTIINTSATPTPTPATPSQEDLEHTAKIRGITVDEVLRRLGRK